MLLGLGRAAAVYAKVGLSDVAEVLDFLHSANHVSPTPLSIFLPQQALPRS